MPRRLALPFLCLLPACASMAPSEAPSSPPPTRISSVNPTAAPIRVENIVADSLRRGTEVGRYEWGIDCGLPANTVYWTGGRDFISGTPFPMRVAEALRTTGHDARPGAEAPQARRALRGDITALSVSLCRRSGWLTGIEQGVSGEGRVEVEWTLRAVADGRVLYRVRHPGRGEVEDGMPEGTALIVERAVADSARRLAADPDFASAASRPEGASGTMPASIVPRPGEAATAPQADAQAAASAARPPTPRVGAVVTTLVRGQRVQGVVAGISRDPSFAGAVVLVDFDGAVPARNAPVANGQGRIIGAALVPTPANRPAWYGLVPVVAASDATSADTEADSSEDHGGEGDIGAPTSDGIDPPTSPPT